MIAASKYATAPERRPSRTARRRTAKTVFPRDWPAQWRTERRHMDQHQPGRFAPAVYDAKRAERRRANARAAEARDLAAARAMPCSPMFGMPRGAR